ncbi:hypothetical protein B0H66DRAFT_213531 [Apodospora peruviana]|uniref:UDP-glucose 6-dehydrogenase n=1 Tax=Apodospora peruviana TaxID=516989 RepID=A0AAE0M7U8_9PEZI|nr:hypothetical protein B0H66DRAFT_213531 [Apodospora peruviana]
MDNSSEQFEAARASLPVLQNNNNKLTRSLPSAQSLATTVSPGVSTPSSWRANSWTKGTPDTSPPSSRSGSPDNSKVKYSAEDGAATELSNGDAHVTKATRSICFIGAGFVGGPTAAIIALHNPDITVNVVDLNEQRVAAWNSTYLPIHETGLLKVVRTARDGTLDTVVSLPGLAEPVELKARQPNLVFSTNVVPAIAEADIIFICVNTPTKTYGVGAGSMADISAIESATRTVAQNAKEGAIIVEKSTVPCGTARVIQDILCYYRPETSFEVLSNPEFLAEGTAVENLMHPDRILIGSAQTLTGLEAAAALKKVYGAWVPDERIVTVNTFSSELAKLVANAVLAQRISNMNAVSAICEEFGLGADVDDVSLAIGKDSRVGPKFLQAGVGFGGSCFEKDILNLAYLATELHLDVVADYWLGVLRMNEYQRQRYSRKIVRELNGSLRGKKIAVLGFAFKDGTNDTRNSIAVHIIKDLAEEMPLDITIFDPGCASADILDEIQKIGLSQIQLERIRICTGWRDAVQDASAVCVLTPWKQFRGCQVGRTTKVAAKSAKTFGLSVIPSAGETITEMDILALEDVAMQQTGILSEDPLGRLRPLSPCSKECGDGKLGEDIEFDEETVDWVEVAGMMREPRWVFDGRNVVDLLELKGLGFRVRSIGKVPVS